MSKPLTLLDTPELIANLLSEIRALRKEVAELSGRIPKKDGYSPKEMAECTGLSESYVYKLLTRDAIAYSRQGSKYIIPEAEVKRFIKSV